MKNEKWKKTLEKVNANASLQTGNVHIVMQSSQVVNNSLSEGGGIYSRNR